MIDNSDYFARGGTGPSDEPYEYRECGLNGIFLHNGFVREDLDGEEFVAVVDTEALHRVIGIHVARTRKKLAPEEVRFLRKEMKLTQSQLGGLFGLSGQSIARWEKGESENVGPSDRLLRVLYLGMVEDSADDEDTLAILQGIEGIDDLTPYRVQLYLNEQNSWQRGGVRRFSVG